MSTNTTETYDFLTLHTTLARVMLFAHTNEYIYPPVNTEQLKHFNSSMKSLFVVFEQLDVLPNWEQKQTLELAATQYASTKNCLVTLFMASPSPSQAKGWFDYQKEFKAREQFQSDLMLLMSWHLNFFEDLVHKAPLLIVPSLTERLSSSDEKEQETSAMFEVSAPDSLYL